MLQSLQQIAFFSVIRTSPNAYPLLLALHIVALIALGGMVAVTTLRQLGIGMTSYSLSEIVDGLRVPKRWTFAVAAICGLLLFGAKAGRYADNPWFWVKMALLTLIGMNALMSRLAASKILASLTLVLWIGVLVAARGPATIKDIMHSMVDPSGDFLFQSFQSIADEHGQRVKAPQSDADWEDVRQRAAVLMNAPDLLTASGRMAARPRDRSKNPEVENEPEEVQRLLNADHSHFIHHAQKLRDAATMVMKAADAKDKDALLLSLDGIDKACESCHLHYWYPNDKRAQEAAKADGVTD